MKEKRVGKLALVTVLLALFSGIAMAPISSAKVGLLVQNASNLDADEDNIQQFLINNSYSYDIIDSSMIKNSIVNMDSYNVLYMRTGSEPFGYNDNDVIAKINTSVRNGSRLVLEYYGVYLGAYLGAGTIEIWPWGPVAYDTSYFVEPSSSNSLFNNINSWSPPELPDDKSHLITELTVTVTSYNYPVFYFNPAIQSIPYQVLLTTYGWNGQQTGSDYCLAHPGLCTSERSVWLSDNQIPFQGVTDGVGFVDYGSGQIYKLGLNLGQMAPADKITFGPVAQQMRKNVVNGASDSTPTLTVISPNGGESWIAGSSYSIQWTYTGNPGTNVKIELINRCLCVPVYTIIDSTNIGNNGQGSYVWVIPSGITSGNYLVRISSSGGSVADGSDSHFGLISLPNPPSNLGQFKSDGTTVIATGDTTSETMVIFKGTVSDPDYSQVKLQIELRRLDENNGKFDENFGGLKESGFVPSGSEVAITVYGLMDAASYHWRARAVDAKGDTGSWQEFGDNDLLATDFVVYTPVASIPVLQWPLNGKLNDRKITLGFGDSWPFGECPAGTVKKHVGIDVNANVDEDVRAAYDGIVKDIYKGQYSTWANAVVIEHGNNQFTTVYWHVIELKDDKKTKSKGLYVGKSVSKGDLIAHVADLGKNTHFHFGIRNAAYDVRNSLAGALPQTKCGGYLAFRDFFINPVYIEYS